MPHALLAAIWCRPGEVPLHWACRCSPSWLQAVNEQHQRRPLPPACPSTQPPVLRCLQGCPAPDYVPCLADPAGPVGPTYCVLNSTEADGGLPCLASSPFCFAYLNGIRGCLKARGNWVEGQREVEQRRPGLWCLECIS